MYTPKLKREGISILFLLVTFMFGCSEKSNEDAAQQLLEMQQKVKAKNQQLTLEKNALKKQLEQTQQQKKSLADQIQQRELIEFQENKTALENTLSAINDSLAGIDAELAAMQTQKETPAKQIEYNSEASQQAKKNLLKSVSEIDEELNELETAQRIEQEKIPLQEQKIAISEKKAEAYKEELVLYQADKNNLLRTNASEDKVREVDTRIKEIENLIKIENAKLDNARLAIRNARENIASTDKQIKSLNRDIQENYDNKDVLSDFMLSEMDRLENEISQLNAEEKALTAFHTRLANRKTELETQIAAVNQQIDKVESEAIIPAGIKFGDNDKSVEPVKAALEETPGTEETTSSQTSQPAALSAETEPQPASGGWNLHLLGIIVAVAVILVALFYFVGKRYSAQKQTVH